MYLVIVIRRQLKHLYKTGKWHFPKEKERKREENVFRKKSETTDTHNCIFMLKKIIYIVHTLRMRLNAARMTEHENCIIKQILFK